jgi:hypothetical protein
MTSELPVVSLPAPADRAELRDRIRRAVCEAEGFAWDSDLLEPDEYGEVADAVLAVLPAPAETELRRELAASERIRANADFHLGQEMSRRQLAEKEISRLRAVVARLRRMTDYWEQQLPDVIRTPAVVSAIRAALEAVDDVRRLAGEARDERETQAVTVSPTAALLASRCDTCLHTLNWHRNDVGCTVVLCVCGRFQPPTDGEQLPEAAEGAQQ